MRGRGPGSGLNEKTGPDVGSRLHSGGAEGIRTPGLVTASHARSQLRHSPKNANELKVLRVQPEPLRPSARMSYTQPAPGSSRKKSPSAEPRAERGEPRVVFRTSLPLCPSPRVPFGFASIRLARRHPPRVPSESSLGSLWPRIHEGSGHWVSRRSAHGSRLSSSPSLCQWPRLSAHGSRLVEGLSP